MASVDIVDICKRYGVHSVIENANIAVCDGEFLSLVGASGCGKSTLLRMIAGLEPVTSGTIAIGGRVVNDVPPKNRDIAMVFQNYALYPHLTVAQNMGFSLELRGSSRAAVRQAVAGAAEILGLSALLDRQPRHLSGGQRQRVAMGRAIVRQPQLFLFDEPLSNLDAQLRVQMRTELKSLQQRIGTTAIYVTHDQIEAMTMSDRIVILNQGRIEQIGAPLDVYDCPANLFVARFIGSPTMNLLRGRVSRGTQASALVVEDLSLPLDPDLPVRDGQEVVCGVRPEQFELTTEADALPLRVSLIEATGPESHIHGTIGSSPAILALSGRQTIRVGDVVRLRAEPAHLHLFDPASGQRIEAPAGRDAAPVPAHG